MALYSFENKYRRLRQELLAGALALAGVFAIGTLWYFLVEKWSIVNSAYMTMITLSTVG
ncbi:MAG TPA: potassium channel protein, partial [Cyanothece sp. UBA12306]|nr:potassium channel protein [Cyanothece sp. UBA12306]